MKKLNMSEKFENAVKGLYPAAYNEKVRAWLQERYGEEKAKSIWAATEENYLLYLSDMPVRHRGNPRTADPLWNMREQRTV